MGKGRLEAFSDGVLAIIITIMVLELKVPHGTDLESVRHVWPPFAAYVVSFAYVAIYWNNHHHLVHTVKHVDGWIMWANMHLLFWLSLIPKTTEWVGEDLRAALPCAAYATVMLLSALAYQLLQRAILRHGENQELAAAISRDLKGKLSLAAYVGAVVLAFVSSWISIALIVAVAIAWVVPDRRVTKVVGKHGA
ncbi:MAG TPA: TMEM175 family protein [Kofleriaceae bacterium]|nr:TMEM175 family protein [Kofleriaceae bacterium]